jgi:hypothetical protein
VLEKDEDLIAMDLVHLILVLVPGIQDLAAVEFFPVMGRPMWWR